MKKLCAVFIAVIIMLASLPALSSAAATGRYVVSSQWANVLKTPSLSSASLVEVQQGTYLTVSEISDDFMKVYVPSAGVTGWIYAGMLTYAGEDAQNTENIVYIEIGNMPLKTVYTEDEEEFDSTGLTVYGVSAAGAKKLLTGYQIYCDSFNTAGTKRIWVKYTPSGSGVTFSAYFDVTVNKVPLKSLTVESKPAKTSYIENQLLDLTGLKLRASYTDGRSDKIFSLSEILSDPDFTLLSTNGTENGKKLKPGTQTMNFYYKYSEITASIQISVSKRVITSFSVIKQPNSMTVYSNTQIPDLTGLQLQAIYNNGETEDVLAENCQIVCNPSAFVYGTGTSGNKLNTLTIIYEGLSVELYFTYRAPEIKGIKLITPKVLTFVLGEETDLSELKVFIEYTSGETQEVFDYTLSKPDLLRTGNQQLTVKYGKYSSAFNITISPYYRRGDIDGDATVTANDARLALRCAVHIIDLKGLLFTAADADRDNAVTAADARLILRAAVKLDDLLAHLKAE